MSAAVDLVTPEVILEIKAQVPLILEWAARPDLPGHMTHHGVGRFIGEGTDMRFRMWLYVPPGQIGQPHSFECIAFGMSQQKNGFSDKDVAVFAEAVWSVTGGSVGLAPWVGGYFEKNEDRPSWISVPSGLRWRGTLAAEGLEKLNATYRAGCPAHPRQHVFCTCPAWRDGFTQAQATLPKGWS